MEKGNPCDFFSIKSDNLENTMITGYASIFNIVDSQNDIIANGAFRGAEPAKVKLLWQHDTLKPIGVIKSLYEDACGLKIEAEINNKIFYGKEAAELVKQKAVEGLSIGFRVKDFEYNNQGIRLLKKIDLMEVSIVTFPANREAGITAVKTFNHKTSWQSLGRLEKLLTKLINFK